MKIFFAFVSLTLTIMGKDKPNLIVIMTDDMVMLTWDLMGARTSLRHTLTLLPPMGSNLPQAMLPTRFVARAGLPS